MFFKSFEGQRLTLGEKDDGLNDTISDYCINADRSHADMAPQPVLGLWPIWRVGYGAFDLAGARAARAYLIENAALGDETDFRNRQGHTRSAAGKPRNAYGHVQSDDDGMLWRVLADAARTPFRRGISRH